MTKDRRKPEGRRESASTGGRRNDNDRRAKDRRGKPAAGASKPARAKSAAGGGGLKKFFKVVAIVFMLALAVFTLIFMLFFWRLDYFMGKVGERLVISVERVSIDPASLTDRSSRANLNLRIHNRLPVDVILQNLNFTMSLSGYTLAKDAVATPKALIKGNTAATVPVWCQADSIMTRRGLQKVIENVSATKRQSIVPALSSSNDSLANDIRKMTALEGQAEFRLTAGGIEVPFRRRFAVGKR
ncbi:MAG TPA: hypothetical protein DCG57_09340 [Candidatus Riflebacteria bacterium]|nr:hypothetical protein [Candidatus Riflebacteria bacterium]